MRSIGIALSSAVLCWGAAHAFQPTFLRASGVRTLTTVSARPLPGLRAPLAGQRRRFVSLLMSQQDEQDSLIRKLADVSPLELPAAVVPNIKEVSTPQFFMRIADLASEAGEEEKEKLSSFASNLVSALEVVVQRTEERMDDSANVVQQVLSAAAEENGEFELPLKEERIKSMRAALVERRHLVDEAALSCLFAYMNKASQDQLDGMVSIFQTMLQQWAAIELLEAKPSNAVLLKMLDGGAEEWDAILSSGVTKQEDKDDLLTAVQQCVEKVVLQKASGSYGQRVQAEFLREMMTRIRETASDGAGAA